MTDTDTLPEAPRRGPGRPSRTSILLATNRNARSETVEDYEDDVTKDSGRSAKAGDSVTVTHAHPKNVVLYFNTEHGWVGREVPGQLLGELLRSGARDTCGDCEGDCYPGRDGNGQVISSINACPARDKQRAIRQCPVCGRMVPDPRGKNTNQQRERISPNDPNLIEDDSYGASTPASRTDGLLKIHIATFHKADAAAYGIRLEESNRF